jgi:isoleucyl-tRNA synthetase
VSIYRPVADKPDHPALEHAVLALWEREGTFAALRERNRGGEPFSFVDGPITANNPMGVHHAWGRSLKDLFQRYKAGQGHELRYQNGFDCQGLWVEVEVEKALGLNSKREIEEYGLERFADACRARVAEYADVQTRQSIRLGQWMDWERSYYTFTDPNIAAIWAFLKECERQGWLYTGHRPMVWCPRCGTSLSQHELVDSYRETTHTSLYVYLPLTDEAGRREGEALLVWTTTPWTLPANVAAAVAPDAEYVAVEGGPGLTWVVAERVGEVFGPAAHVRRRARGSELVGRPLRGPLRRAAGPGGRAAPGRRLGRGGPARGVRHRPHRSGLRRGGLRSRAARGAPRARAGRRGGRLPGRLRLAARHAHAGRGPADRRGPGPAWQAACAPSP